MDLAPTYFRNTLESLQKNYFALFKHFGVLNFWLSLFDQVMVIAPYALVAPLVFASDPEKRITLGTLIKLSNSFEKVFSLPMANVGSVHSAMRWRTVPGGWAKASGMAPTMESLMQTYCKTAGRPYPIEGWLVAASFCHFRLSVIIQGIAARVLRGQASSEEAAE